MNLLRVVVAVLTAAAALLVLAPVADAAPPTVTARIGGLEYAATDTEGRFGGAATGAVPGAWLATVAHDPLDQDAVPITGGSFVLRGPQREIRGTFVRGSVTPLAGPDGCGDQRFAVAGTLAIGGGRGAFRVVLTHLRVETDSGCRIYGALVGGSLTVPARAAAA